MFEFILRTWHHSSPLLASRHILNRAALCFIAIFCFFCWCLSTWFHRALPNITKVIADVCNKIFNWGALVFAAIFLFCINFEFILRTWQHSSSLFASRHIPNQAALFFIALYCFFCLHLSAWIDRALPSITTVIANIYNKTLNRVVLVFVAIFCFLCLSSC